MRGGECRAWSRIDFFTVVFDLVQRPSFSWLLRGRNRNMRSVSILFLVMCMMRHLAYIAGACLLAS